MSTALHIKLYTRPGCQNCREVAEQLAELQGEAAFVVDEVDISSDLTLHHEFWAAIPVVEIGDLRLRAPINPLRLETAVLRAVRGHVAATKQGV